MNTIFRCSLIALLLFSCAKIPVQSVYLADALQEEGARMHNLNLHLLNQLFIAKRYEVEKFINTEYAPKAISNFIALVSKTKPDTDFKKDFPDLMQAISPEINARRDSLVNALDLQKEKLAEKLNADFHVYNNAASELRHLLESATKVDKEKQVLYTQVKSLSNSHIDFNSVEAALDKFIHSTGNVSNHVAELNNSVNQLMNNK